MNLNDVREETKKHLGNEIDLSYITQKVIDEMKSAKEPDETMKSPKKSDPTVNVWTGTTITVSGGRWFFKGQCTENWYSWGSQLDFSAIGNCPNGRQLFNIWPR
jgi:hypothetical protein